MADQSADNWLFDAAVVTQRARVHAMVAECTSALTGMGRRSNVSSAVEPISESVQALREALRVYVKTVRALDVPPELALSDVKHLLAGAMRPADIELSHFKASLVTWAIEAYYDVSS